MIGRIPYAARTAATYGTLGDLSSIVEPTCMHQLTIGEELREASKSSEIVALPNLSCKAMDVQVTN